MINHNYINSSSSSPPFLGAGHDIHHPIISTGDLDDNDHHQMQHHQFFVPNSFQSSSSTSLSCHMFFNSSPQDQSHEYYHHTVMNQLQDEHHHDNIYNQQGENRTGGSYDQLEKKEGKSLKFTLWKNEKQADEEENQAVNTNNKWMSSKMRLMQKMKNSVGSSNTSVVKMNHEDDQKLQGSSSFESDHFSSNASSSTYNGNPTVRVCADCNTTKTPLWRSGPKGPKSLCNACGIRQRKARRAMAAAAAAAAVETTTNGASETATLKIKVQNKEKIMKKRCSNNNKITGESSSHDHDHDYHDDNDDAQQQKKKKKKKNNNNIKKNVFEDFLMSLSENLSFHRVFPQDEKEAAILLMALSCGLVHG